MDRKLIVEAVGGAVEKGSWEAILSIFLLVKVEENKGLRPNSLSDDQEKSLKCKMVS